MHALAQSRTRRSLTILVLLGLGLAGVIAARYALLPLIWHHAAMHFYGRPLGLGSVYHHARPLMHYWA